MTRRRWEFGKISSAPRPLYARSAVARQHYRRVDELMFAFADVLHRAASELTRAGAELIVLSEPCLVYEAARKRLLEFSLVHEAVRAVGKGSRALAVHNIFR